MSHVGEFCKLRSFLYWDSTVLCRYDNFRFGWAWPRTEIEIQINTLLQMPISRWVSFWEAFASALLGNLSIRCIMHPKVNQTSIYRTHKLFNINSELVYRLHHQFWAQFITFSSIFCLQVRLCNSIAQGQHPQFFIEGLEFNFPRSANWLDMVSIFLLTPCHVLLGMLSKQKQEGKRFSTKVIKRNEYMNNLR